MGDPRGFLKLRRQKDAERPVAERVHDWREFVISLPIEEVAAQASRCMDCGVPFCHRGCPLGNLIPEWNDLVHQGKLEDAARRLHATNNFPEVTGRVCPAPCEASCVLNIEGTRAGLPAGAVPAPPLSGPVTIKAVERTIADAALGLEPQIARRKTGKRIAVVGSGPAGLAAAQELARAGHDVTLFERDDRIGGLLRYGIPDFKMEKAILDRRIAQMRAEGVAFRTGVDATAAMLEAFDANVIAIGARTPRDLPISGRDLDGVHFAMEFLTQQNRRVAGDVVPERDSFLATGKRVAVIGGGDTGSDCVGTAIRQGARSVLSLELMPKPSVVRLPTNPWPEWPLILRTSSSHEEGAERDWAIQTRALRGCAGRVTALDAVRVTIEGGAPRPIHGTELSFPCELVLLAMGFVGPEKRGVVDDLGLALDARGNIVSDASGATSVPGVFAAGDASRGQSLVVWAIADGRRVAAGVDAFLRRGRSASALADTHI
jgi:glutamate synthase (NADPH/NADH) small chain